MNFWLIKRPEFQVDTGEVSGLVVVAGPQSEARRVCAETCGAEGPAVWTDPKRSTCILIGSDRPARVILRAFNQG